MGGPVSNKYMDSHPDLKENLHQRHMNGDFADLFWSWQAPNAEYADKAFWFFQSA